MSLLHIFWLKRHTFKLIDYDTRSTRAVTQMQHTKMFIFPSYIMENYRAQDTAFHITSQRQYCKTQRKKKCLKKQKANQKSEREREREWETRTETRAKSLVMHLTHEKLFCGDTYINDDALEKRRRHLEIQQLCSHFHPHFHFHVGDDVHRHSFRFCGKLILRFVNGAQREPPHEWRPTCGTWQQLSNNSHAYKCCSFKSVISISHGFFSLSLSVFPILATCLSSTFPTHFACSSDFLAVCLACLI